VIEAGAVLGGPIGAVLGTSTFRGAACTTAVAPRERLIGARVESSGISGGIFSREPPIESNEIGAADATGLVSGAVVGWFATAKSREALLNCVIANPPTSIKTITPPASISPRADRLLGLSGPA